MAGNQLRWTGLVLVLALILCACGRKETSPTTIQVNSSAFNHGEQIPVSYTCDGQNISPAISWGELPGETQSLALIVEDPDAPIGVFTHWVYFNIDPKQNGLRQGVDPVPTPGGQGIQGVNDFGKIGYGGPCPPRGKPHRYFFKLYALDRRLDLDSGAFMGDVQRVMKGHILAEGELLGVYGR